MSASPPPPDAGPVTAGDAAQGRVAALHARMAERHGAVFASTIPIGWGAGPCVVLVGPDALAQATGVERDAFSSEQGWTPVLGTRFGRAVLNADEPQHAQDRRRWAGALSPVELERWLPALQTLAAQRTARWSTQATFDAYPATRELAFAGIATTLGGFADDARLAHLLAQFSTVLEPAAAGETEAARHARVAPIRDELEALLSAHVAGLRAPGAAARGLLPHLVRLDPSTPDSTLLAHLNLLLVTGMETTASLMAWALHRLAQAHWQEWLREELTAADTPTDTLSMTALDALPRLDAFVREAGRLHPPLVCAPRRTVRDVDIAGIRIAADTLVALGYGGTDLLPASYADPHDFRPERWLEPGAIRPATFSGGHRLCMGMRFAQLEIKTLVAQAVSRFDIAAPSGEAPRNAGFWNARASGGSPLRLRPRHDP